MDCLGYRAHDQVPMFSARLGVEGDRVVFLGSISGATIDEYLDSALDYLAAKGFDPDRVSECRDRALELMTMLSEE